MEGKSRDLLIVLSKFEPERLNWLYCLRRVSNNITRCISCDVITGLHTMSPTHTHELHWNETELFPCILLSCDCKVRCKISRAPESRLRKPLPSPLPSSIPLSINSSSSFFKSNLTCVLHYRITDVLSAAYWHFFFFFTFPCLFLSHICLFPLL